MKTIIVKESAVTNKMLTTAIKEAKRSTLKKGVTKSGINYKRLLNTLILF